MHSNRTSQDVTSEDKINKTSEMLLSEKLATFYELKGMKIEPNFTLKDVPFRCKEIIYRSPSTTIISTSLDTLSHKEPIILKSYNSVSHTPKDPAFLIEEAIIMQKLQQSPHIIKILGICYFNDDYWIVMKPYSLDLRRYLEKAKGDNKLISLEQQFFWARDISYGLAHIHELGYVHCDIKSYNIFLDKDENNSAKIGDFGSTLLFSNQGSMADDFATLAWMAPELFHPKNSKYNVKTDIYSLGILLWEIVTGNIPFKGKNTVQLMHQKGKGEDKLEIPEDCNSIFRELILACCNLNPDERPLSAKVIGDAFDAALKRLSTPAPASIISELAETELPEQKELPHIHSEQSKQKESSHIHSDEQLKQKELSNISIIVKTEKQSPDINNVYTLKKQESSKSLKICSLSDSKELDVSSSDSLKQPLIRKEEPSSITRHEKVREQVSYFSFLNKKNFEKATSISDDLNNKKSSSGCLIL